MLFGAVKINKSCIQRIFAIFKKYVEIGNQIECIVLMLDEGEHEEIDLRSWLKGPHIFVVPHLNNDGPRLLPKVPVMKKKFNATKILTNPAKFSIYGR